MDYSKSLKSTSSKPKADIETSIDLFDVPDCVEMLDTALQQSNVNVNLQDRDGTTVLSNSLQQMNRSDSFIMRLLNANADPNISDRYGATPLYYSITRPTITIANELIKKGANINARTKRGRSALHQTVDDNNLEAVCLLLYYGVDVNIKDDADTTPFLKALSYRNVEISQVLIDYYDGCLDNILYYAIKCDTNLAVRLIEMGANVNYITPEGRNMLNLTLFEKDPILFKMIWERFDYRIILNNVEPFLIDYIYDCAFATNDWMDCLCLLLNSCVAIELVQECNDNPYFFEELFSRFCNRKVQLSDRLRIIYHALSLSMKVSISDINSAYNLFGFHEEFEILIYHINYDDFKKLSSYEVSYLMLPLFLGIEDDLYSSFRKIIAPPCVIIDYIWPTSVDWLGYFNRSCYLKIFQSMQINPAQFSEKLRSIPKFPTLVELSRNQSRKSIRQAYNVKKPYQFHDAVKSLKLPQYVEDIIRFKTPIYF